MNQTSHSAASNLSPWLLKNFMLNPADHGIFPANKCLNANNCWQFNIYELENSMISLSEPKKAKLLDISILISILNFMFS